MNFKVLTFRTSSQCYSFYREAHFFGSVHSKIRYSTFITLALESDLMEMWNVWREERDSQTTRNTLPFTRRHIPSPFRIHISGINSLTLCLKYSDVCDLNAPSWHRGQCCLVYDWLRLSFIFTPCSALIGPAGNISHLGLSFMIGQN